MSTFKTFNGQEISVALLDNYLDRMVGQCYKILPMRENGEPTLQQYINSTIVEIAGCGGYIQCFNNDSYILSILSILKYLEAHPDTPISTYKREVFKAIRFCKDLRKKYTIGGG